MTDVQREALAELSEVWSLSPDVRLGQLMTHLDFLGEAHLGKGLGYIEDDELIAVPGHCSKRSSVAGGVRGGVRACEMGDVG